MSGRPEINNIILQKLYSIVGKEYVLTSDEDRLCYSYDGQRIEHKPDAIVRPSDASQISEIFILANDEKLPIIPRGGGTGLSGGSVSPMGGIVLDLTRMNRIIEIDQGNMHAVVEPGLITAALISEAEKNQLLYPPDPGSVKVSTIGGNIAENAGGLRACKYGVTRNYLMQLKGISPTGEAFKTGAKTRKCVAGYDLVSLLCGSEGTLGVITEATVRLVPLPKYRKSMVATFASAPAAGSAVSAIISSSLTPATLEIIDNFTLRTIEEYAHLGLPVDAGAMILAEFDGLVESAVTEEAGICFDVLKNSNSVMVRMAESASDRDSIWEARRTALAALSRAKPTSILEDVTVPLPKLSEMIEKVEAIARQNNLSIGTFGHAGDGNLHPTILTDERNSEEMVRVENAIEQLIDAAIALDGTVSGEHGIGLTKAGFLRREVGDSTMDLMKSIKRSLDPNNILNPGKFV